MQYHMTIDDAGRIEALLDITKVGLQRGHTSALGNIQLRFQTADMVDSIGWVRAVATDSYRLIRWDFEVTIDEAGDTTDGQHITVQVSGEQLARAIKALRTTAPKAAPDALKKIVFTPYVDGRDESPNFEDTLLEVGASWDTEIQPVTLTSSISKYPNWKQLVTTGTRAADLIKLEAQRNMQPAEGQQAALPAFDPEKLASMWKLLGMTATVRKKMHLVQLLHTTIPTKQAGAYLRPWIWAAVDGDTSFSFILMPVNSGDHDNVTPEPSTEEKKEKYATV